MAVEETGPYRKIKPEYCLSNPAGIPDDKRLIREGAARESLGGWSAVLRVDILLKLISKNKSHFSPRIKVTFLAGISFLNVNSL